MSLERNLAQLPLHLQPGACLAAMTDHRYRQEILPDFPPNLVTVKFILGTPAPVPRTQISETAARALLLRDVAKEMREHDDMVMLDVSFSLLECQVNGRWSITSIWERRTNTSNG